MLQLLQPMHNDIAGAKTDVNRPIPDGDISLTAARIARALLWCGTVATGLAAGLTPAWWVAAFTLFASVILYNRLKRPLLMGLCRALNVLCGAALFLEGFSAPGPKLFIYAGIVSALWFAYVSYLTYYASDENTRPTKRPVVSLMILMIVYLQLLALIVFAIAFPPSAPMRHMLFAGAGLLIVTRVLKMSMRDVSAT